MTCREVRGLLESVSERWLADLASDVIWVGYYEGRRGVRVRLSTGEVSTVWFQVGEWTLRVEAYLLSPPVGDRREEVYRQSLARNASRRRLYLALDRHGDVVLVGRVPLAEVNEVELDLLLGEAYEGLGVIRPALARAACKREKNT